MQVAVATLAPADIIATTAGSLSHAQGLTLVAAPGANFFLELVSCTVSFTFATAVYTGGAGNVTVNIGGGGAALTGLVTGANSFIKASSNINQFVPLSTAANSITANTALSLVTTAAFTQPGTAAGTARIVTVYRTHSISHSHSVPRTTGTGLSVLSYSLNKKLCRLQITRSQKS